jgi:hypothetical protein
LASYDAGFVIAPRSEDHQLDELHARIAASG